MNYNIKSSIQYFLQLKLKFTKFIFSKFYNLNYWRDKTAAVTSKSEYIIVKNFHIPLELLVTLK